MKGAKVSVGAPFFNQVNIPLFLSLIFLTGIGPSSPGAGRRSTTSSATSCGRW